MKQETALQETFDPSFSGHENISNDTTDFPGRFDQKVEPCCPSCGTEWWSTTKRERTRNPEMFKPIPNEDELPPEIVYLIRSGFFQNTDLPLTPEQTRAMDSSRVMASENKRSSEYWKFYKQKSHEALGKKDCLR